MCVMPHEVRVMFDDQASWRIFAEKNPWVFDQDFIAGIGRHAREAGVLSHFLGHTPGAEVEVREKNLRGSIVARGLISRVRAMLDELAAVTGGDLEKRILMLEAMSPFAGHVRALFPHALGTEYLPTQADRERFPEIRHCDICGADFDDASFDVVVSNDVLEHVPDLMQALAEMRRLLSVGGIALATFPFKTKMFTTEIRAVLREGTVEHLAPPEFHGDPVRREGALVFAIPGWDVLDKCRAVGFESAQMVFVSSIPRGITASQCAGVFILSARA